MYPGSKRPGLSVRRNSHPPHLQQLKKDPRELSAFEELSEKEAIQAQVLKGLQLALHQPKHGDASSTDHTKLIQTHGFPKSPNPARNPAAVQIVYQNFKNISTEHSRSFYGINFPSNQGISPAQLGEVRETISATGELQVRRLQDVQSAQEQQSVLLRQLQASVLALQQECSSIALKMRNTDLECFDATMTVPQMPRLCMQMVQEAAMLRQESENNRKQAQDMLQAAHMMWNAIGNFERSSHNTRKQLQAHCSEDPVKYILIRTLVARSRRLWELETWKGYLREFDTQICTVVTLLSIQIGNLGPPPRETARGNAVAMAEWGRFRVSGTPKSFTMLLQLDANEQNDWCGMREVVRNEKTIYSWRRIFRKRKSFRWTFIARTDSSTIVPSKELVFYDPTTYTDLKSRQDFFALSPSSFCAGIDEYIRGLVRPYFNPQATPGVSRLQVVQSGLVFEYEWNYLGIFTIALIVVADTFFTAAILKWFSVGNAVFWCGAIFCFRVVLVVTSVMDILEAENTPQIIERIPPVNHNTHQCAYTDRPCEKIEHQVVEPEETRRSIVQNGVQIQEAT